MRLFATGQVGSALLLLTLGGFACSPKTQGPAPQDPSGKASQAAAEKEPFLAASRARFQGAWAEAEAIYLREEKRDPRRSRQGRAELRLITGNYEQVAPLLEGDKSSEAALLRARALRATGNLEEALSALPSKEKDLLASLSMDELRGEILLELGRRKEAEPVFLRLIEAANGEAFSGLKEKERAKAWGLVGQAAHYLRSPEDANDAFNESENLSEADVPLLLARAKLFLEKFDFAHAGEVIEEATKKAPRHPDVLLARAQLLLESSLAFVEVEELAKQIQKTNPRQTGAHFLLAGIHLRNLALTEAMTHVDQGLQTNPRDLELLSMKATTHFLAERPDDFEATVGHIHKLSPGYVDVFRIVSEYAEWEHRYPDIEKLMRRAIRLDREDGRARGTLGLTLVRSGSDPSGVIELRKSFELDPFNVRVLNTLDLYEKIIPTDYVEERAGPFSFRFPKAEADLLRKYVPPLLDRAYAEMVSRYGFTPQGPIGIEIYASREQFSVRTSGLPQVGIQGVCFGRKLATMSPLASPGNLGMTLWHELAHVFHIGLSQNRVPRWLTEGLAEWETARRGVGWSRELDPDLYRALRTDSLPHLASMSRAFTHARRFQDVSTAYYASGEIAQWIVESHGEKKAVQLLSEFGNKRLPKDVVPEVLAAPFEELDTQFRKWAGTNLRRFDSQFVSMDPGASPEELRVLLKKAPKDRALQTRLAVALLLSGETKEADQILTKLLKEKFDPEVAFFRARLLLASEKKPAARALLERILKEGHDGYEIRMMLARLDVTESRFSEAKEHLEKAVIADPLAEEAWSLLTSLALQRKDREAEIKALTEWARLSEHDPMVHRRLLQVLIEQGREKEAAAHGEHAVWVDLAGFETHRLFGLALSRSGNFKHAEDEWESALLCPASPSDLASLGATWKEELTRAGKHGRASGIEKYVASRAQLVAPSAPPEETAP